MPVLKAYTNSEGYYIRARPSDIGNVTYQVDPSLWNFFEDMGYEDGSEVEWSLIKSFRIADLVYTKAEGVADINEDVPGLDPSRLTELTPGAVEKLLKFINSRKDLSESKKLKIQEYIKENHLSNKLNLTSIIQDSVESALPSRDAPWGWNVENVLTEESSKGDQHRTHIEITISGRTFNFNTKKAPRVIHTVIIVNQNGKENYTEWNVESEGMDSWSNTVRLLQQKATLIQQLNETLSKNGYDLGKPEKVI